MTLRELLPHPPRGGHRPQSSAPPAPGWGRCPQPPALTVKLPQAPEVPAHVGAPMAVTPSTWRRRLPGTGARGAGALRGGREGAAPSSPPPRHREEGPAGFLRCAHRRPVHPLLPPLFQRRHERHLVASEQRPAPLSGGVGRPRNPHGEPPPSRGPQWEGARSRPNSPRVGGRRGSAKHETRLFTQGETQAERRASYLQTQTNLQWPEAACGVFSVQEKNRNSYPGEARRWRSTRVTSVPHARGLMTKQTNYNIQRFSQTC